MVTGLLLSFSVPVFPSNSFAVLEHDVLAVKSSKFGSTSNQTSTTYSCYWIDVSVVVYFWFVAFRQSTATTQNVNGPYMAAVKQSVVRLFFVTEMNDEVLIEV